MYFICKKCKVEKKLDCFYNEPNNSNGIKHKCKECCAIDGKTIYNKAIKKKKHYPKNQTCINCKLIKPRNDFYVDKRKKNGLDSHCKLCRSLYNKKQGIKHSEKRRTHEKNKRKAYVTFLDSLKYNKPCIDCGRIYPPECMDFDHISGEKKFNISSGRSLKINTVLEEIKKCELVCSNCHRTRTRLRYKA